MDLGSTGPMRVG